MAYDKVVDSAKLDGALKKTADAIREKRGTSASFAWNATTGFSAAVSAIEASTELQYASGTFTAKVTMSEGGGEAVGEVTGLAFKPKMVVVYAGSSFSLNSTTYFIMAVATEDGDGNSMCASYNRIDTDDFEITLRSSGFVVYSGSDPRYYRSTYNYIAVG